MTKYWLLKSEPDVYSINHLKKDHTTLWEGVRNYQARNFMISSMQPKDKVLFYHSNAEPSGIAGIAEVLNINLPDPSQFNKKSEFYDPKAKKEKPIWFCSEIKFVKSFKNIISLQSLKNYPQLADMLVLKKGQRLSVQPVTETEFQFIIDLDK